MNVGDRRIVPKLQQGPDALCNQPWLTEAWCVVSSGAPVCGALTDFTFGIHCRLAKRYLLTLE